MTSLDYVLKNGVSLHFDMKRFSFILALVVFFRSLSVCGPDVAHSIVTELHDCHSKASENKKQHACCHANTTSEQEEHSNDCCGDDCHCFCCMKVVLFSFLEEGEEASFSTPLRTLPIAVPAFHSFDFHPSIAYPPNALV